MMEECYVWTLQTMLDNAVGKAAQRHILEVFSEVDSCTNHNTWDRVQVAYLEGVVPSL